MWPPLRAGTDDMMGARSTRTDGLQHEVRHRRQRAGVAGADHRASPALLHEVDGDAHRGVLAPADGLARMLGHAHHGRRRMNASTRAQRRPAHEPARFDDFGVAHEDQLEGGIGGEGAAAPPGMHSGAPLSPLITSTAIDGMRYERKASPAPQLFFGLDFGRFFDDAFAAIKPSGVMR